MRDGQIFWGSKVSAIKRTLGFKFTWFFSFLTFAIFFSFQNCSLQGFESGAATGSSVSPFALDSLTLATVNNPLQNSCLCIDCGKAEIKALAGAQCTHIRWGRFPWDPWERGGLVNEVFNTSVKQPLKESVSAAKETFGRNVSFEFGIPEYFHNNYRQLSVSQSEMTSINNYLRKFIPEQSFPQGSQTPFSQMQTRTHGFAVPILDHPVGLQWHFYLAKLAIDSGATSIYISQVNLRLSGSHGANDFIRLIKALRAYAYEVKQTSLIVGAESLYNVPEPYPGAFVEQIQYLKFITDTDVAQLNGNGRWVVLRKDGSELECLGQEHLDKSKPPSKNQKGQLVGQICVATADSGGQLREYNKLGHRGPSFMSANPHKIPVLLELDGCQDCDWISGNSLTHSAAKGAGNTVFYKSHGDESLTTCHSRVRNGLSTTMQFISQPKWVREAFMKYMVRMSLEMTQATGTPTYFPRPVKVDQNHYWQLAQGNLSRVAQQRSLVRQCPLTDDGPSQSGLSIGLHYMAQPCGDLDAVIETLMPDFLDRVLKRPSDQPPLFSEEQLNQLYLSILQRHMEEEDYPYWLSTGKTLAQIESELKYFCENNINGECSQEDDTPPLVSFEQVAQAYNQILNRSGSPIEISYWVNSGKTLSQIHDDLTFICENKLNGECSQPTAPSVTSDQVAQAYVQILKRSGSSSEISYWINSGKTLSQIQSDLSYYCENKINGECSQPTSPSVTSAQVAQAYIQILKRSGSSSEIAYWINSGKTLSQIQSDLTYYCQNKINGECSQPVVSTPTPTAPPPPPTSTMPVSSAGVTGSQVAALYYQILKRSGKTDEINYWLNSGKTLSQIQADLTYYCQNKINGECSN